MMIYLRHMDGSRELLKRGDIDELASTPNPSDGKLPEYFRIYLKLISLLAEISHYKGLVTSINLERKKSISHSGST
jgi:hypothetical protein